MEYTTRNCKYDDLEFILKLKELGLKWYIEIIYGWDIDVQREKTKKELDRFIDNMKIIQVDNKDIGVTTFFKEKEYYCVGLTIVHPDYQNKGIASDIIKKYINTAKEDNIKIIIKTYKENPAKNLYEKLGFKKYDEDDTHIYLEIL